MHRSIGTLMAVILLAAAPLAAQDIAPRGGTWGAEVNVGDGTEVSLLRFSSPSRAWLLGLSFTASRERSDASGTTVDRNTGFVAAKLGHRWWSGTTAERLRPFTGLGVGGAYSSTSTSRQHTGFVYGELGATYFFSPHVSLGAAGNAQVLYGEDQFGTLLTRRWLVRGTLVRLSAGVYF